MVGVRRGQRYKSVCIICGDASRVCACGSAYCWTREDIGLRNEIVERDVT